MAFNYRFPTRTCLTSVKHGVKPLKTALSPSNPFLNQVIAIKSLAKFQAIFPSVLDILTPKQQEG